MLQLREPVILPKDHRFTVLVIESCHERVHHGGVRGTLAELRARFWVPKGRQGAKKVLGKCVVCAKLRASLVACHLWQHCQTSE